MENDENENNNDVQLETDVVSVSARNDIAPPISHNYEQELREESFSSSLTLSDLALDGTEDSVDFGRLDSDKTLSLIHI